MCTWCIRMCVLRERVSSGKSVSNEPDLSSSPQETTGVFCWDPPEPHVPGDGDSFWPGKVPSFSYPVGAAGTFQKWEGEVRGHEARGGTAALLLSRATGCYRHCSGSCGKLVGPLGNVPTICPIPAVTSCH